MILSQEMFHNFLCTSDTAIQNTAAGLCACSFYIKSQGGKKELSQCLVWQDLVQPVLLTAVSFTLPCTIIRITYVIILNNDAVTGQFSSYFSKYENMTSISDRNCKSNNQRWWQAPSVKPDTSCPLVYSLTFCERCHILCE